MKVILYQESGLISHVFHKIFEPQIDKKNNVIHHNNGKIYGIKDHNGGFLIVDDEVEVKPHDYVTEDLRDQDVSSDYDKPLTEKIKDGIEEIKEEVEEFFDGDDDDPNKRDFLDEE